MSESVIDDSVDKTTENFPAENQQIQKECSLEKHLSKTTCALSKDFFAYGCSLQGKSHKISDTPCQDFSDACIVETDIAAYVIAAVADGVGSCYLSHYGSAAAIKKVMKMCTQGITDLKQLSDENILALLRASFAAAQEQVEVLAEQMQQLPFSFFSTLTVCIYDGKKLHIGHIGDDGVVALFTKDHSMELVTERHKGEEANSVRPLQFGESSWQFMTVEEPVDGFILATDGVLDSFVTTKLYENMVYAPFVTNLLFQPIINQENLDELLNSTVSLLDGEGFRDRVSDDISIIAVGNRKALYRKKAPAFDINKWNAKIDAVDKRVRDVLYSKSQSVSPNQSVSPARSSPVSKSAPNPATSSYSSVVGEPALAKPIQFSSRCENAYPRQPTHSEVQDQAKQSTNESFPEPPQHASTQRQRPPSGSEIVGDSNFINHQGKRVPPNRPYRRRKSWLQNLIDCFSPPRKHPAKKRAYTRHYPQEDKQKLKEVENSELKG